MGSGNGSMKRSVGWELVSPASAENWLGKSTNEANRNARRRKVEQYARDMAEGRWTESNDAITFDEDGKLLNGQHRLMAIVKHGKPVEMLVARGVPRSAQVAMDTGSKRLFADHLQMAEGRAYSTRLAAAVRQGFLLENKMSQGGDTSTQELLAWLQANPSIDDSVRVVNSFVTKIDASPTAVALAHWKISKTNTPDHAELYLRKLALPAGEPEGSAIFAVLSRLRTGRDQKIGIRPQLSLLIRGWNRWATGQSTRTLPIVATSEISGVAKWERGDL